MRPKFALGLRACCTAMALALATAHAAEKKPSLLGATREQVLARLGEPKSEIVAGNREILFFAHERVVLRDEVVVEVEAIAAEAPKRTPPPAAPATAVAPAPGTAPVAPAAPAAQPAAAAAQPASSAAAAGSALPAAAGELTAPVTAVVVPPPAPEPTLEIRLIRPSSAKNRPAAVVVPEVTAPVAPPPAPAPAVEGKAPASEPVASGRSGTAVATDEATPTAAGALASKTKSRAPASVVSRPVSAETASTATTEVAPEPPKEEETVVAAPTGKKKAKVVRTPRRKLDDADLPDPVESIFTVRTYALAFIAVVAGAWFLVWRNRQRQLELAATAVSRTPFNAPVAAGASVVFAADLLAKLEWKRFEELVTSYYSKTGVVAVRTKTGPNSPVHIKISWKGEPKPFACVRCMAHPTGLIDAAPLQELDAVLAAEDIRRGYVVTTGKFGVPARDFAEEKHLTLLSGDLLLEKLNALPDAARAELKQEITTGDYTTPSCPKCEAKMVRSSDDPSLWKCAAHADMTIRAP